MVISIMYVICDARDSWKKFDRQHILRIPIPSNIIIIIIIIVIILMRIHVGGFTVGLIF